MPLVGTSLYAIGTIVVIWLFGVPGAVAAFVVLPTATSFERPASLLVTVVACAALIGGIMIPMVQQMPPGNIPYYTLMSGLAAAIIAGLHILRTRYLGGTAAA